MKKISLIFVLMVAAAGANAQTGKPPLPPPPGQATTTPGAVPNYSQQGNSSYENNSMQNNKPADPNAGPYTGNGNYVDPTKNQPAPTLYNNNMNQMPAPTPVNTNGQDNLNRNGIMNSTPVNNR